MAGISLRNALGLVVAAGVAAGIWWGVNLATGEEPPPPLPTPPSFEPPAPSPEPPVRLTREEAEAYLRERGIFLSEPVPEPIEIDIGPRTILLPKGATIFEVIGEPAPGVQSPWPTHYWEIERGRSRVWLDADTGKVVLWKVDPEDEEDFQLIENSAP
ncbi:MAG: hypothetical protein HYS09_06470 [Chloroflexi bacterium]|nr:hypothetical protein [Chloroflexota bacterium]